MSERLRILIVLAGSRTIRQPEMAATTVAADILPAISGGILPPGTSQKGVKI